MPQAAQQNRTRQPRLHQRGQQPNHAEKPLQPIQGPSNLSFDPVKEAAYKVQLQVGPET